MKRVPGPAALNLKYEMRPLVFEANRGQADPSVRFLAHGSGYSLFLTDSEAILALRKASACPPQEEARAAAADACAPTMSPEQDIVHLKLAGSPEASQSAPKPAPAGEDPLPDSVSYFLGNDPSRWQSNLPTYARVRYDHVYPGVDLVFYGNQHRLEYDFLVAPGADPTRIELALDGAKTTRIDASTGDLVIAGVGGELRLQKPVAYQIAHGRRVEIRSGFRQIAKNQIGFSVGARDRALPLVIDPMLTYATYLGGSANDSGSAIALDASGSAYVFGTTNSTDFPTLGPIQSANANPTKGNVFIAKFTPDGSGLIYSTYLGGTGDDSAVGLATDPDGNAYIAGNTGSTDFPTVNPLQGTNHGAADGQGTVFVAKINPSGSALVFSTFLGGSGGDSAAGIGVDPEQNVYVAGNTGSTDFPLQNPLQATNNCPVNGCGGEAFASKINAAGSALLYSTYLGGSSGISFTAGGNQASGIAVDAFGEAVVVGTTGTTDFPVSENALEPSNPASFFDGNVTQNGSSGFVTKYEADGSGYVFSTYLGGGGFVQYPCGGQAAIVGDHANAVALDTSGNVYVTGATFGMGTVNSLQPFRGTIAIDGMGTVGNTNAYVTEFKPDGSAWLYSTYLGGDGVDTECGGYLGFLQGNCQSGGSGSSCNAVAEGNGDDGTSIAVDLAGSVYVAGHTGSPDFPVRYPIGAATGPGQCIAKLHTDGSQPIYSTYFGEYISAVTVDAKRNVYITGATSNLPITPGAFQATPGGGTDAYVAKITITGTPQTIAFDPPDTLTFGQAKDFTRHAIASSGLPVQFAVVYGQATMKGNVVTPTWAGYPGLTIEAYQLGNSTYEGASARIQVGVNPATLTVAAANTSMTYGSALPALTYYPISGLVRGDGCGTFTGTPALSTTATSKSEAGQYPITVTYGTLEAIFNSECALGSVVSDSNYIFAFKNATLTVKRAKLTVTANSFTIHQGQRFGPELKYTITGFVNGDSAARDVKGWPILTTTARFDSPPGKYPILVKQGTLSARNYNFTEVDGFITIVK